MRWSKWSVAFVFLLVSPNLLWLGTSTVKISNTSGAPVGPIAYRACDKTHQAGILDPSESIFRFLEACGDDTLVILVRDSEFCQIYVEGELYHVDVTVSSKDKLDCVYDHLFSSLFILKAVW